MLRGETEEVQRAPAGDSRIEMGRAGGKISAFSTRFAGATQERQDALPRAIHIKMDLFARGRRYNSFEHIRIWPRWAEEKLLPISCSTLAPAFHAMRSSITIARET